MYSEAIPRAEEYARRRSLSIEKQLGGGTQGVVFWTDKGTAIKALTREDFYRKERDAYRRLKSLNVNRVCGFWVPRLFDFHDELWVVEMEVVKPPYVLDFASAYLDSKPSYLSEPEVMEQWEEAKREEFEGRWPIVRGVIAAFQGYGIYLPDIRPGNIMFAD